MIAQLYALHPLLFSLLVLLLASVLVQLVFYLLVYLRVPLFKPGNDYSRRDEPVSVIVCARDEYHNLQHNLPILLEQDYDKYEVVVVNHGSEDDTAFLLRELELKYPRLKVVNVAQDLNFFSGKKFPLSIGIRSATYELLLFTDADCKPAGTDWVRKMASNFSGKTEIVLGYGAYAHEPGLLNLLIRFDTLRIALNYLGFARARMPYMGVGRNLAYRKSLFFRQNGFISHYNLPSGDDDLFVNKAANNHNTRIEIRPGSATISRPKRTMAQWLRQKRRHMTTGAHYRLPHKLALGLFVLSQGASWLLAALLIAMQYQVLWVVSAFAVRLLVQLLVYGLAMRKLGEKGFLLLVPGFELFLMALNPVLAIGGLFSRPAKWS